MSASANHPDLLVIGAGLIGLASGIAAAERGFRVAIVAERIDGESSPAAAGLLAPSIEQDEGPAQAFALAARDRYPEYVRWLLERTGIDVPLNRRGIIQVALNDAGVRGLRRALPATGRWLDATELAELEPALAHARGGALHPTDGAADNVVLLAALRRLAESHERLTLIGDRIAQVRFVPSLAVVGTSGMTYEPERVLLAAGAWSSGIAGLPRSLPVEPVRGQMISYAASALPVPLTRAVYGPTGYLVPRADGRLLIGATMERVGFDVATTDAGITRLRRTAAEVFPVLEHVEPLAAWAGLRPISADLQPIIGIEPSEPRLLYATGHSRNGVLMTPLTADCIAAILAGDAPPVDVTPFAPDRFNDSW